MLRSKFVDSWVDRFLFKPMKSSYNLRYKHERRVLFAVTGTVGGVGPITVPCMASPSTAETDVLVVHFHGTSGDVAKSGPWYSIQQSPTCNVHVVSVEYPGYGVFPGYCSAAGSPMPPSDHSILLAARVVMNHVLHVWQWPRHRVVVSGRSMGSGPAIAMAAEFDIGGLVVISGFASLADAVAAREPLGQYWVKALVRDRFGNEAHMAKVRCPTLIAHGERDTRIGFDHAVRLHAAASNSTRKVLFADPTGTHRVVNADAAIAAFTAGIVGEAAPIDAAVASAVILPKGPDGRERASLVLRREAQLLRAHHHQRNIQAALLSHVCVFCCFFFWLPLSWLHGTHAIDSPSR